MTSLYLKLNEDFSYDKSVIEKLDIKENCEITLEYISDFRSAKVLRDFISNFSRKFLINKIWERRFVLIVDELNNNAIEYGTMKGDYNKLKIYTKLNNNILDIKIEVIDKGNGKLPKTKEEMEEIRQKRENISKEDYRLIRGRGLFMIISKLVDRIYFENAIGGGLIVGIEKKLEIQL